MIESIKALFGKPNPADDKDLQHKLNLAAAALLIEMSRADYQVDPSERSTLAGILKGTLALSEKEITELVEAGAQAADKATSLYEFTRLINDHYEREEKRVLVESMWRVAYADGDLDKYEERLIRQVSDLIHVSHKDYIRAKLIASGTADSEEG